MSERITAEKLLPYCEGNQRRRWMFVEHWAAGVRAFGAGFLAGTTPEADSYFRFDWRTGTATTHSLHKPEEP